MHLQSNIFVYGLFDPTPDEVKIKQSLAQKGKKQPKESVAKMVSSKMGHKHSEETKKKMSAAAKGKKKSAATKKRMSEAQRKRFSIKKLEATSNSAMLALNSNIIGEN